VIAPEAFRMAVARAALAPSVHNTQPARYLLSPGAIHVVADPARILAAGDPEGRDAGLSCGAAVEALEMALAGQGVGVTCADRWSEDDRTLVPGLRLAAVLTPAGAAVADPLESALERRFTHRGRFRPLGAPLDWRPEDAVLLQDVAGIARIAALNDKVSLQVLRRDADRAELLSWMRLARGDRRWAADGMNREALRMGAVEGWGAGLVLGPLWRVVDGLGLSPVVTAEAAKTRSAAVIAAFHRPAGESPVTTGRAYLRLVLGAAARGLAMWPMAALADDPATRAQLSAELGLGNDRRLIQMIRMGPPDRPAPARARLPVEALIL
jgi:nitroreductase